MLPPLIASRRHARSILKAWGDYTSIASLSAPSVGVNPQKHELFNVVIYTYPTITGQIAHRFAKPCCAPSSLQFHHTRFRLEKTYKYMITPIFFFCIPVEIFCYTVLSIHCHRSILHTTSRRLSPHAPFLGHGGLLKGCPGHVPLYSKPFLTPTSIPIFCDASAIYQSKHPPPPARARHPKNPKSYRPAARQESQSTVAARTTRLRKSGAIFSQGTPRHRRYIRLSYHDSVPPPLPQEIVEGKRRRQGCDHIEHEGDPTPRAPDRRASRPACRGSVAALSGTPFCVHALSYIRGLVKRRAWEATSTSTCSWYRRRQLAAVCGRSCRRNS